MNDIASISRRRRILRWVLIGVGLCFAPFVILAVIVASYLTLDHDATYLRREMMAATNTGWKTKVQLSVGKATIDAVNFGIGYATDQDVTEIRTALAAVRRASVGVYERTSVSAACSPGRLFRMTDQAMSQRGWSRMLGVKHAKEAVVIYVPQNMVAGDIMKICLAVLSDKNLVVVSTEVDPHELAELVKCHSANDFLGQLRLAGRTI